MSIEVIVLIISVIVWAILIFIIKQIFNIIFRGFTPFMTSRPWVIDILIDKITDLDIVKYHRQRSKTSDKKLKICSIGSGRSGLLHFLGKNIKNTERIGVEYNIISYFNSKIQAILRQSKIKVVYSELWQVNIKEFDIIYLHLDDLILMRDFDKKFKFECKKGAIIISNGFVVPNFIAKKVVEIDNRKARFSLFSSDSKLLSSRKRKAKKENKVYFYEI